MGNSEWFYFVPYQEDIEQALRQLRREVFEEGRYYKGPPRYSQDEVPASLEELVWRTTYRTHSILDIAYVAPAEPEEAPADQGRLFALPQLQPTPARAWPRTPRSLDYPAVPQEVTERNGGIILPVSRGQLWVLFGTTKPTRWMVIDAREAQLLDRLNRCIYLVVYEDLGRLDDDDAKPEQISFYGWSGGGP